MGSIVDKMYRPKEKNVEKLRKLARKLKEEGKFKEEASDTLKQHNTDTRSDNGDMSNKRSV